MSSEVDVFQRNVHSKTKFPWHERSTVSRGGVSVVPFLSPLDKKNGPKVMTNHELSYPVWDIKWSLFSNRNTKKWSKNNLDREELLLGTLQTFQVLSPCFIYTHICLNGFEWWRFYVWEFPEIIEKVTNYAWLRYVKFFQAFSQSLKFTGGCELLFN